MAPGTPAFMAPEVARGRGDVDGRADLYALGCVGYWLLTGRRVFESESVVAMLMAHANDTPSPPSANAELEIAPSLDAVVLACLQKDPENRPSSADDLAHRLEETGLASQWTQARARRWWQTHNPMTP